jgi:hypothetical protein
LTLCVFAEYNAQSAKILLVDRPIRKINNNIMLNNLLAQAAGQGLNLIPDSGLVINVGAESLIQAGIVFLLVIAAIVFFFMLLIGGVKYILSGGDKGKTEAARGQITAALIGLVIVFAAWAILNLMATFLGVGLTNLCIPSLNNPACV